MSQQETTERHLDFWGRERELALLSEEFERRNPRLVVIYGRRRIGKSSLINKFVADKPHFAFEGIEGERTPAQIAHFKDQLREQTRDRALSDVSFHSWDAILSYLTDKVLALKRPIIVLDELQWMAAGRTKLVSLLKYYWDNKWKPQGVMLILCGSIASFMVKKVLNSRALYGRINVEIHLTALRPPECAAFLPGRSPEEILNYLLILGGIPKYLEEIDSRQSFEKNINRLCFSPQGALFGEFERIFYGQFAEARSYLEIVNAISGGPRTLSEISSATKIPSGGGLRELVANLEKADFIRTIRKFGTLEASKEKKYGLSDEYISFYLKFIKPNTRMIKEQEAKNLFQKLVKPHWSPWLGFAFERFCQKQSYFIAKLLGFAEEVEESAALFERGNPGFQVDLLYRRTDKVIVACEIKHHSAEIDTEIIPEFERKLAQFSVPRGYSIEKALISLYGPSSSLRKSGYFQHYLTLAQILNGRA